jgi:hypothetical protein
VTVTAVRVARFFSLLLVGLALGAGLAHVFALPNKMDLPGDVYLVVQQIYSGWTLLDLAAVAAVAALGVLTVLVWQRRRAFFLTLAALAAMTAAQALFWVLSFPADRATEGWTTLPADWPLLRDQWEYSHAAGAGLELVAFVALIASVVLRERLAPRADDQYGKRHMLLEYMSIH